MVVKKIDSDSFARIGICCDFEKYDAVREMGYEFIEMFGTQVIEMSSQELRVSEGNFKTLQRRLNN